MSLSGALYNAFSGLRANTRAAGLVSANISNATTEGYGRRVLSLSSGATGTAGGVRINGVVRQNDPVLTGDRMQSDAAMGRSFDLQGFYARMEQSVGSSGEIGSLTGRVTNLENALVTAASNPSSTQRLESVATAANDLANTLNKLSDTVQSARTTADRQIASQVRTLNESLVRLDEINADVVTADVTGSDPSALLDERQRLLDTMSDIVPLRVTEGERGKISIFTTGGAVLLSNRVAEISFDEATLVSSTSTLAGGGLSGITFDGRDLGSDPTGLFSGGSLAAQFDIRDQAGVDVQAQLDGIARDLAERLGAGGPDTTLGVADPGLFTDAGAAFDPLNEAGFAGRISLNALVAPGSGGSWRLRDGLGAATTGEVGDATLLQAVAGALIDQTTPGSAVLNPVARSFADQTADFASSIVNERVRADADLAYQSSQNTTLREMELAKGVDTDQELQRLMQIEQNYAANARMMSVVDELMERLLAI